MSKKAFVIKHYSILILCDENKYSTFWALCLEQSSSRTLISYVQATLLAFPSFVVNFFGKFMCTNEVDTLPKS